MCRGIARSAIYFQARYSHHANNDFNLLKALFHMNSRLFDEQNRCEDNTRITYHSTE